MNFNEMSEAVQEAERTLSIADRFVAKMAYLIVGRLKSGNVSTSTLCCLKRELADYNMHTGTWKEKS